MYFGDYVVWKGKFINNLIKDLKIGSYLELGVAAGETWYEIDGNKTGVDISPRFYGIISSTTDEFFKKNTNKYDLIFIDACHEKNHVKRDFCNSYNSLSDNGIILLHDVNPPDERHTSLNMCGNAFEFWMELSKIAVLRTFNYHTENPFLGKFTDTVGIFVKSENKNLELSSINENFKFKWDDFSENKIHLIESKHKDYQLLIEELK